MATIITDEASYKAKLAEFTEAYKSDTLSLDEKIKLAEELVYCDYARTPGHKKVGAVVELASLYKEAGYYQKQIDFVIEDVKANFNDDEEYALFMLVMARFIWLEMIDSQIILGRYDMAKSALNAMIVNDSEGLENNPDGPFAGDQRAWLKRCMAECARIEILQKNYEKALEILSGPILEDDTCIGKFYYGGILFYESPIDRNIKAAVNFFTQVGSLNISECHLTDLEEQMVVKSNYYLGLIYSTESGFRNKEKAIAAFRRAKQLGYAVTDEEIKSRTDNIVDDKAGSADSAGKKKKGCYVATCVYGSYDCPEVWTLRRFRDNTLSKSLLGRLFILLYYTISPVIVKYFGKYKWFGSMWKKPLDKMVKKLIENGTENTPYTDL